MTETARTYSLALALGVSLVGTLIWLSHDTRYAFTGEDGWGYIQEATNLLAGQGAMRAPTGSYPTLDDRIHSAAFPPGFSILIASISKVTLIEPAVAGRWIAWVSWALLPLAVVFALRPLLGVSASLVCGVLTVLSPGGFQYGYAVLSDVPFLLAATLSFGLLARALKDDDQGVLWWALAAGLAAGAAYSLRNAGIANIAAFTAVPLAAVLLRLRQVTWSLRIAGYWTAGWLCFGLPLIVRNVLVFGVANPYSSSAGGEAGRPLLFSARMYLESLLLDLTASRTVSMLAWDYLLVLGVGLPVAAALCWLLWKRYLGATSSQRLVVLAALSYLGAGSAMVVLGRHLFPWVETDLLRHVVQYTWLLLGIIGFAICGGGKSHIDIRLLRLLSIVVVSLLITRVVWIGGYLQQEVANATAIRNVEAPWDIARHLGRRVVVRNQLKKFYSEDHKLAATIAALPSDAILATNHGSVAGLISGRPVRNIDFASLEEAGSKARRLGAYVAGRRPLYLLYFVKNRIVWNSDYGRLWKVVIARAIGPDARVVEQTPWWLLMEYGAFPN